MERERVNKNELERYQMVHVMELDWDWVEVMVDMGWYLDEDGEYIRIFSKKHGSPIIIDRKKIYKKSTQVLDLL